MDNPGRNTRAINVRRISRISAVSGRLRSIHAKRRTGEYRLLVHTGAAINIIQEKTLDKKDESKECETTSSMRKYVHTLKQKTTLNFFNKEQTFYIVPDDFPLPEEGIIGIKSLSQYDRYSITPEYLIIDKIKLPIYEDGEFLSPNLDKICRIKIKEEVNQDILFLDQENIPDGIYRVNEGFVKIPIRNNTLNPLQVKNNLEKYEFT